MDISFLKGKHIHVIGLGKTGLATAHFFQQRRDIVSTSVWDDNEEKQKEASEQGFIIDECVSLNPADDILIWSPGIPHYGSKQHPIARRASEAGVTLISDLDILCKALPDQPMIAVTGTNGKSTTTALIHHALQNFVETKMGGNIGSAVLGLQPMSSKDGIYVLECSSYQLELTPNLAPQVAILLNITKDHIERHGSMENYCKAKENIFNRARNDGKQSIAIIGHDTKECEGIAKRVQARKDWIVIPLSTKEKMHDGVWVDQNGYLFDKDNFVVDLNTHHYLKGEHNFENLAASYAALRYTLDNKISNQMILDALFRFKGLAHRQFFVSQKGAVKFINDSKATNADATDKALKTYDNIYWIAGGEAKAGGLSGLEQYKDKIKYVALIGKAQDEFADFLSRHDIPHTKSGTLENAVHDLWLRAQNDQEDSVILLSPAAASFDQFTSFEQRGDMFINIVERLTDSDLKKGIA